MAGDKTNEGPLPLTPAVAEAPKVEVPKVETPKVEVKAEAVQGRTSLKVEQLKDELERTNMDSKYLKQALEYLPNVSAEDKPFILSLLIVGLNKKGISFSLEGGKIILSQGKSSLKSEVPNSSKEEVASFQTIFHNYLGKTFSIKDLGTALLYKTTSIGNYIGEKAEGQTLSVDSYVSRLMQKYGLHIGLGDAKEQKITEDNFPKFKRGVITGTPEEYKTFKAQLSQIVTNVADRDYLMFYFDEIRSGEKNIDKNGISMYKEASKGKSDDVLNAFSELSSDQLFVLGVRNENDLEEMKAKAMNAPMEFITEMVDNGMLIPGLILAAIGGIFGGGWGAVAGFLFGTVGITGIQAYLDSGGKTGTTSNSSDNKGGIQDNSHDGSYRASIFKDYYGTINSEKGNLDEKVLETTFSELTRNDKFKNAKASTLEIFEKEKIPANIQKYFKEQLGIELTDDNKKYYEHIFKKLKDNRQSLIGAYGEGESVLNYLNRASKLTQNSSGVSQNINLEQVREKTNAEILGYFNIDAKQTKDLQKNLELLGLDMFKFLGGYKNFIEKNLSGLDPSILAKIKEAIKIKILLVNKEIEELKKKEKNMSEFKNNRWIVNSLIQDLFKNLNTQVLPSALALVKNNGDTVKLKKTKEMFAAKLTSDGDFDKEFFSKNGYLEAWDSYHNNWDVFSLEADSEYLRKNGLLAKDLDLTLLSEKDKDIESDAEMFFYASLAVLLANDIATFSGAWTVPGVIIGSTYSAVDLFNGEDNLVSLGKMFGYIPDEYRLNKEWYQYLMALIGAVPLVGGGFRLTKGSVKVANFTSKLSPAKLSKFKGMMSDVSGKFADKFGKAEKVVGEGVEGTGDLAKVEKATKVVKISEDNFIKGFLGKVEVGVPKKIGDLEVTRLENGKFKCKIGTDEWPELPLDKVMEKIKSQPQEARKTFVDGLKNAESLSSGVGKSPKNISGHNVSVEGNGFKVLNSEGKLLQGEDASRFIAENLEEIHKAFTGVSIEKGFKAFMSSGIDMSQKVGPLLKKLGIGLGKAGESPSHIKIVDMTLGEVFALPRMVKQLAEFKISDLKHWGKGSEELAKILILTNKNVGWKKGIFVRGMAVGAATGAEVFLSDKHELNPFEMWYQGILGKFILDNIPGTSLIEDGIEKVTIDQIF